MFIVLEVIGLMFIVAGVSMVSQPAAYVVLGIGILLGSYLFKR